MKAFFRPTLLKITLAIVLFIISSLFWNQYFIFTIDTIDWGFRFWHLYIGAAVFPAFKMSLGGLVRTHIEYSNLVLG